MPARLVPFLLLTALASAQGGPTILRQIDGSAAGDRLGSAVATLGDIDRDGFDDFAVGSPDYDAGSLVDAGRVQVFSGASGAELYSWVGDGAGDAFGFAVGGAGDVDGDGVPDVIAGAIRDDDNGTDCGMARVFSGADGSVLYTFYGDSTGDEFGTSVNGAGDLDNDGHADLIVGAPWDEHGRGGDAGSAYVYSGRTGALLYRMDGDNWNDHFGNAVAGVGDVDADGFDDFIVGAPWDDNTFLKSGSARVFSGRTGAILYTFDGTGLGYELGWSVSYLGDINGDGHADLLIGEPENKVNGDDAGSVRVYSGIDGSLLWFELGLTAYEYYGFSIGSGDVDGDGIPDVIVGSYRNDVRGWDNGACFVYSGATFQPIYTVYGDSNHDRLGQAVSSAGDINGDGFADVLAGIPGDDNTGNASGSARVFCGIPSGPSAITYGAGCPAGSALQLSYVGSPRLDQTLNIAIAGGPAGQSIGWLVFGFDNGAPFPLDLTPMGLPGCRQYQSLDLTASLVLNNGAATLPLTLPAAIAPCGLRLFHQAVSFDLTGSGGFQFSNGGRVIFYY